MDFHEKEKQLLREYRRISRFLKEWAKLVDGKIDLLLSRDGTFDPRYLYIPYGLYTLKSEEEIIAEAFYRRRLNEEPLKAIEDKIVIRGVLPTLHELNMFKNALLGETAFWDLKERLNNWQQADNAGGFVPKSYHIIVRPTDQVPRFENLSAADRYLCSCDIQIRTILQYALEELAKRTIDQGPFSASGRLNQIMKEAYERLEETESLFQSAIEVVKMDSEYKDSFLSRLIAVGENILRPQKQYDRRLIDMTLTKEIFDQVDVEHIDIIELEHTLIKNQQEVSGLIHHIRSYLGDQPVTLLLAYLVIMKPYHIRDRWHLEEEILAEVFQRLGYAYER